MGKDSETHEENIRAALIDAKSGLSFRKVAKRYGIPKSTLAHRLKIAKIEMKATGSSEITCNMGLKNKNKNSKFASHQIFSQEEEQKLVNYLLLASDLNYGLYDPADDSYFNNFLSSLKPSVSQELCDPGENLITVCAHQSPKTLVGKRPPPEAHKFATIQRLIRNHHSMEEPLDLSMKKPEVPLSPRSSRISQLFGNLCKIKPLPHPGAFLKSSRARESHSIIATGSPEIQRRIQLAKEKEERKVTQEKKRLEAKEKRRKRKEDQQRKNEEKEERKRLKEEKKEASEAAKGKKRRRNENLENKQQPKKIPNDVSCLEESIQPDTEPPLKKKRGRPRKVPLTPLTEDNNNNV
ncbi:hypothetical protein DMENIID0001_093480 [Sergentomyia squamirostris]